MRSLKSEEPPRVPITRSPWPTVRAAREVAFERALRGYVVWCSQEFLPGHLTRVGQAPGLRPTPRRPFQSTAGRGRARAPAPQPILARTPDSETPGSCLRSPLQNSAAPLAPAAPCHSERSEESAVLAQCRKANPSLSLGMTGTPRLLSPIRLLRTSDSETLAHFRRCIPELGGYPLGNSTDKAFFVQLTHAGLP